MKSQSTKLVQRSSVPSPEFIGPAGRTPAHPLQRFVNSSRRQTAQSQRLAQLQRAPATGNPNGLPQQLRAGIEELSGMDMSDVVVHRNSAKPAQLNALAYAQGRQIHLGVGQKRHLPHEAWHLVQQRRGSVQPTRQVSGAAVNDDRSLEAEADRMGHAAAGWRTTSTLKNGDADSAVPSQAAYRNQAPMMNAFRFTHRLREDKAVQCAKLNLRDDGTISGVSNFPKRPTSNVSGGQGQHLTAYVTFEDMIRNNVRNKMVKGATGALIDLLGQIAGLPGMGSSVANYLREAIDEVVAELKANSKDAKRVGNCIDTILSIRNKVPGTAAKGQGGGHGESKLSGVLNTVEKELQANSWNPKWDQGTVANQCLQMMWRLLDYDPPEPKDKNGFEDIGRKTLTHFLSLRMAYPSTFAWLTKRRAYLFKYFPAHRKEEGMPLSKLAPSTVDKLTEYVHSKL